jgi:hypothetical protein
MVYFVCWVDKVFNKHTQHNFYSSLKFAGE